MSFLETPRLDDCVAIGFQTIPTYATQIAPLDSGREQRNISRTRALRRFAAEFRNWHIDDYAILLAHFHAVAGSGYGFRMRDHTDYTAENESLGNTPGANQTPVQLIKTYTSGTLSRVRTINKPASATVQESDGAGGWVDKPGSLATATGLFTPTSNWTAGRALRWSGEFDVPVRFESDELPSIMDEKGDLVTVSCSLIEILL